jgi:hypothetical protein
VNEYEAGYIHRPRINELRQAGLVPLGTEAKREKAFQDYVATSRVFESGASRDLDDNKLDYEGFLNPLVLQAFAEYMHGHRVMKDGSTRASDNWQNGMPVEVYMKSLTRHFMDLWLMQRTGRDSLTRPDGEHVTKADTLGGLFFNLQGLWLETIKDS